MDNAKRYSAELYKKYEKKWKLNNALIKIFLICIILILGALMVWLAWRNGSGEPIGFIAVFSIAAAIVSMIALYVL